VRRGGCRPMPRELYRWEQLPCVGSPYSPRTGHAVLEAGGKIFVFGGTDGNARQSDVHGLDTQTQEWQELRPQSGQPPPARSGTQAVFWRGCVWCFGGYTRKDGEYFNDVHRLELATKSWHRVHTLGDAPAKRTDHSMVLYGGSALIYGGFDGRHRYNDLQELQLGDGRWVARPNRTEPRSRFAHTAVLHEAQGQASMFVFAGWDGHDTLQELYEYDIQSEVWYPIAPQGQVPAPRYRHSAVVHLSSMFTFGGVDKQQSRFADLHEYDISETTWAEVRTHGDIPSARTFHRAVVCEGQMYILGGFDGHRQNDTHRVLLSPRGRHEPGTAQWDTPVETFGPDEHWQWQAVPSATETYSARTGHGVVVWRNYFYLFGGTDENARQNDLYEFDVNTRMWRMISTDGSAPNSRVDPSAPSARSGAKAVVYRDTLYLFGGYTKKEGEYFNDLYSFDLTRAHTAPRWQKLSPLGLAPSMRTDHTCCIHGYTMYVFGGFDGKSRFQDVQELDLSTQPAPTWQAVGMSESQPMGRFGHSACMYKHSMFVFGGWNGHDTLDDLYEFSVTTKQFYPMTGRGEVPSSRYRHSAVVYGCCMFVFGGVDKRQARFSDLYEFNIDQRVWSVVHAGGDCPSARTFHRACIYGGAMYLLGGFDGTRRSDMYRIPLPETQPREDKARKPKDAESGSAPDEPLDTAEEETEAGRLKLRVLELQHKLEREEERHICKICYEREINTVIMGCFHRVLCLRCLENVSNCPLCRGDVSNVIQTYNA